jgi:uncharacterized protein (UPF0212 family)
MRKCPICGDETKNIYCDDCAKSINNADKAKQKNKRYYLTDDERKEKAIVRSKTNVFLKRHGLVKDCKCQICGNKKSETHHLDYADIMFIIFVCPRCHKRIHAGKIMQYSFIDIARRNRVLIADYVEQYTKRTTGNA